MARVRETGRSAVAKGRRRRGRFTVAGVLVVAVLTVAFVMLGKGLFRGTPDAETTAAPEQPAASGDPTPTPSEPEVRPVKLPGKSRSLTQAVSACGTVARERMAPGFSEAGVAYPPQKVTLAALKDQRVLEVWAERDGKRALVKRYPVLAASGKPGPKLREGDLQVPEGVYRADGLNPNSAFHLSIKVDYPNEFDSEHARKEGRTRPGGDIFIHGSAASAGCLAMGDVAIEELFVLVADVGTDNVRILIAPSDPRTGPLPDIEDAPSWLPTLYARIDEAFDAHATSKP